MLVQIGSCVSAGQWRGARAHQQDVYVVEQNVLEEGDLLIVVCDGHAAKVCEEDGEVAARIGCQYWPRFLRAGLPTTIDQDLRELFLYVHTKIASAVHEKAGTTVTVFYLSGSFWWVAYVGDSPAYLLRCPSSVELLTPLHNTANVAERDRAEDAGLDVTKRVFWNYEAKHGLQISRSLGDMLLKPGVSYEPEIRRGDGRLPGSLLLIGSDGMTEALDDPAYPGAELCRRLCKPSWEERQANLVELVESAQVGDNTTAVMVDLDAFYGDR